MRSRRPAQLVIDELLRQHGATPPRSAFARFFGVSPLAADSVSWYLGATGEIEVGRILAQLPPEWTVFHALPIGTKNTDLDHLVVGPGGVFTINTKYHSGKTVWVGKRTVMINGRKHPYLRAAESEANKVTKLIQERMPLPAPARPLIVVVDPKSLTIKERPEMVTVLTAQQLRRWLTKRPAILSSQDLAQLVEIFDNPASWRQESAGDPGDARLRFEALHAEARSAHTRRVVWSLAGTLAIFGAAWALVMGGGTAWFVSALTGLFGSLAVGWRGT
ncbi:hypothetical protein ASC63_03790 [Leifsonia sp. Root112D2]|nr:hypothetical protein ASC63_03790 [Leifsonia sp. Root112D2]